MLVFSLSCSRSNPKIPRQTGGCPINDPFCTDYSDDSNDDGSDLGGDDDTRTTDVAEETVDIEITPVLVELSDGASAAYTPKKTSVCNYSPGLTCSASGGSSDCKIYEDTANRSPVKTIIWDEMYRINESLGREQARCRADLAVVMAMQEAHSFAVSDGEFAYDNSKNSRSDGAQNVSLFNMNVDFIKRSCHIDCDRFDDFSDQASKLYLNKESYLKEAVRRLSEGFDHFGIDGTLYFHRGGSSGYDNPTSDVKNFASKIKGAAGFLRENTDFRKNESRVAHNINQI
jgi:hypothetical protein